jgi:hypothetical protein
MTVYEFDPDRAPDADYASGTLEHLVVGNRGRLLDARRTPMRVTAVRPQTGAFEIEITAFEDAGARWELGLDEVARFQFTRDAAVAPPGDVKALGAARDRFCIQTVIEPDPVARTLTLEAIALERVRVRESLDVDELLRDVSLEAHVRTREGHPATMAAVRTRLAERGLTELDERFAAAFVSNPRSGELVKGHAVVLAELGLCPYQGPIVRDPGAFEIWPKHTRAEHIVLRLALMSEVFNALSDGTLTLFRAAASEGSPPPPPPRSFVSATLSREIAEDHFAGGPQTTTAVMWRQRTPTERVFMTFLETPVLNQQFKEAEAILIGDPAGGAF